MRLMIVLMTFLLSLGAQAASSCHINKYLKSVDGQEKLNSLVERSKSLILSKLEEQSIDENQVQIKAIYPKSAADFKSSLSINITSKTLQAEGASFTLSKVIRDEDCGLEVIISGGSLMNKESGKNFGSLGRVKEFIRLE